LRSAAVPEPLEKRTSFAWNETVVVQPATYVVTVTTVLSRLSYLK